MYLLYVFIVCQYLSSVLQAVHLSLYFVCTGTLSYSVLVSRDNKISASWTFISKSRHADVIVYLSYLSSNQ